MGCKGRWCCGCMGAGIAALGLAWGVVKDLRSAPPPPATPGGADRGLTSLPNGPAPVVDRLAGLVAVAQGPLPDPDTDRIRHRLDDLDKELREQQRTCRDAKKAREEAEARQKALEEEVRKLHDEKIASSASPTISRATSAPPSKAPQYTVVFRHLGVVKEPKWINKDPKKAEHYGKCLVALGFPSVLGGKPIVTHWASGWSTVAYESVPEWHRMIFADPEAAEEHASVLRDLGFECRVEHTGP